MIKTPEIPTDNLYKFISIFGLIIFIFSIYLLVQYQNNFDEKLLNRSSNNDILLQKSSENSSRKLSIQKKIDFQQTLIRKKYDLKLPINLANLNNHFFENDEFQKDYFVLTEFEYEKMLLCDEEKGIERELKTLQKDIGKNSSTPLVFFMILLGVSFFLMIFGFSKWYHKTQKLYDKQILLLSETPEKLLRKIKATEFFFQIYYSDKKNTSHIQDYSEYLELIYQSISFYRKSIEEILEKYTSVLDEKIIDELNILKSTAIRIEQKQIENDSFDQKELENFSLQLDELNKLFRNYVV